MPRTLTALCCLVAIATMAVLSPPRANPPLRVLFVGNSHFAQHAVPDLVRRLAASRGVAMDVGMLAVPGTALVDHAASPALAEALAQPWDWVVLQQGPSSRRRSGRLLLEGAREIAGALRGSGTRMALMSVWPPRGRAVDGPAGEAHYAAAAREVGGCLLPAASAFGLADTRGRRLHADDGLHAAPEGALLAALTIVDGLLGDAPQDAQAPPLPQGRGWQRALAALPELRRAAASALAAATPACFPAPPGR